MLKLLSLIVSLTAIVTGTSGQTFAQDEMAEAVDVATQLAGLTSEKFQKLVSQAQDSVVVIEIEGRNRQTLGIGTGFVVGADGLIATNLHVIGEARPIRVRLRDGTERAVTAVYGTDKTQDVAVVKIDATELKPLKLGQPDSLKQGQPIFALGNPQGLEHSVVTGVVSGFREDDDGKSMIQLAIPIERGNSGGPLMDMQGNVHGLLTLKSIVTDNLGYAVRVQAVQTLLEAPNPIPMNRWLTIGTLNRRLWEPQGVGVNWRQRAGVIKVDGIGNGFGGRSICLSKQTPPELPFELAVDVKIEEDDGAAGLMFHSDGGDVHYGFYPSSGGLRLSRFDGPTVYQWNVLHNTRSRHFLPQEWNRLKVRISKEMIACYCNDELIFEHVSPTLTGGQFGLVKFRHTTASFKRFRFASELPSDKPESEVIEKIEKFLTETKVDGPPSREMIETLSDLDRVGQNALRSQADQLEKQASQLRTLADELHAENVRQQLVESLNVEDGEIDLLRAALLVAALDNRELEVNVYLSLVDQFAEEFHEENPDVTNENRVQQFNQFFFQENGFHGSRTNYYNASNSYLNEVIDDREGLPLTLSILYVELARRVGIDAVGVGLPGHFIVRVTDGDESKYFDVFERGEELNEADCRRIVREITGLPWSDDYLDELPADAIISRMLRNLIRVANDADDLGAALRYVRTILAITPDSAEDRLYKAVICYNTDRLEEGEAEVEWVLRKQPEEIDLRRVRELFDAFQKKRGE